MTRQSALKCTILHFDYGGDSQDTILEIDTLDQVVKTN